MGLCRFYAMLAFTCVFSGLGHSPVIPTMHAPATEAALCIETTLIYKEPSDSSSVLGYLNEGNAADVINVTEDWCYIESGSVRGYSKADTLVLSAEGGEQYAQVKVDLLNVRSRPGSDSDVIAQVSIGEQLPIRSETVGWFEIVIGTDNSNCEDMTGYVKEDYVSAIRNYTYAESAEERAAQQEKQAALNMLERERAYHLAKQQIQDATEVQVDIVEYAKNFIGVSYVWGGTSLAEGVDCSGFVQTLYQQFGYAIPRVSADQANYAGKEVALAELEPGDLIFYGDTSGNVNHVALYIGGGKIIHARGRAWGVTITKYTYRTPLLVRRVIHEG